MSDLTFEVICSIGRTEDTGTESGFDPHASGHPDW